MLCCKYLVSEWQPGMCLCLISARAETMWKSTTTVSTITGWKLIFNFPNLTLDHTWFCSEHNPQNDSGASTPDTVKPREVKYFSFSQARWISLALKLPPNVSSSFLWPTFLPPHPHGKRSQYTVNFLYRLARVTNVQVVNFLNSCFIQ